MMPYDVVRPDVNELKKTIFDINLSAFHTLLIDVQYTMRQTVMRLFGKKNK